MRSSIILAGCVQRQWPTMTDVRHVINESSCPQCLILVVLCRCVRVVLCCCCLPQKLSQIPRSSTPSHVHPPPKISTISKCLDSLSVSSSTKTISSIVLDTAPLSSRLQSSLRNRRPYRYAVSLVAILRPVVCISDLLKFTTLVLRSTCSTTPSAHTALEPFSGATIGTRD